MTASIAVSNWLLPTRDDKPSDCIESDMVSIHVIGLAPMGVGYCGVGGSAGAGRFGTDDEMLAIRFVPDRDDFRIDVPAVFSI